MLEFLIEEIFVELGGTIFQQITSIPMGTSCAPLLATLFLDSYEVECIPKLSKTNELQKLRPLIAHSDILVMFCQ